MPSAGPPLDGELERRSGPHGLTVARKGPSAGGYTTRRYGRPRRGIHALQIEINRGLYMDEHRIVRSAGFSSLKQTLELVIAQIIEAARLLPKG